MIGGVCGEGCGVKSGVSGAGVSLLGWEKSTEKVKVRVSENIVCLVVDGEAKGGNGFANHGVSAQRCVDTGRRAIKSCQSNRQLL